MKVGDRVEVLDDEISGVIVAVQDATITVLTTEDFELDFRPEELVRTDRSFDAQIVDSKITSQVLADKAMEKPKRTVRVKPKERAIPAMEVDLHIEKLVPHTKYLNNYDMLTIQLDTAKRQLDFAIAKRIQRVVFIHGVGDGVLKADLESLIRRYENIKYYDADYKKYGRGATEVYFYQNKSPSS